MKASCPLEKPEGVTAQMGSNEQGTKDAVSARRRVVGLSPPARSAVAGAQLVTLAPDGGFDLVRRSMSLFIFA